MGGRPVLQHRYGADELIGTARRPAEADVDSCHGSSRFPQPSAGTRCPGSRAGTLGRAYQGAQWRRGEPSEGCLSTRHHRAVSRVRQDLTRIRQRPPIDQGVAEHVVPVRRLLDGRA